MGGSGVASAATLIGGRYELEAKLGAGGAGEVWRARHVALGSHVAIKLLHGSSADDGPTRERFLTEARVTAKLETRYAVRVFDFGVTGDGQPYLVMELLDGETLGTRLRRVARLSPYVTVRFLTQAARALARAHSLRIVHRDFKPDNVIIVAEEEKRSESIKVLDFGIAKWVRGLASDDDPEQRGAAGAEEIVATLTRTGSMLGTPRYMAPEQIACTRDLGPGVDIWALGVVAFECLTGVPPFAGKELVELFANIQCGVHPRAGKLVPSLPATFDAWFEVACATHAADRFASATFAAAELANALGEPGAASSERASEPPSDAPRSSRPTLLEGKPVASPSVTRPATPAASRATAIVSTPAVQRLDEGFHEPPWDEPLDVQACLDAIPAGATMKGIFTGPLVAEARRRRVVLAGARDRYLPFVDYPLVDHARFLVDCARGFFPETNLRQGLRRLGWWALPSFLQSLVGRVLWATVHDVEGGLDVAAKAYSLSAPSMRITRLEGGPGRARLRAEGLPHFLDSNHFGVFEGVLRACKVNGKVLIRVDAPGSGELLLTWT